MDCSRKKSGITRGFKFPNKLALNELAVLLLLFPRKKGKGIELWKKINTWIFRHRHLSTQRSRGILQ